MPISFSCPQCGNRIEVSWRTPGDTVSCRQCGTAAVVPSQSEPPIVHERRSVGAALSRHPTWILAALIPTASMGLAMMIGGPIAYVLVLAAVPISNGAMGALVGRGVARWRFLCALGVAAVGWVLSFFACGAIADAYLPRLGQSAKEGLGILILGAVLWGLITTPLAGIVAIRMHSPQRASSA